MVGNRAKLRWLLRDHVFVVLVRLCPEYPPSLYSIAARIVWDSRADAVVFDGSPEGLKEVFTTGGMPPLVSQPDAIYERTFKKVVHRNKLYYEKFPQDVKRVRDIISHLASNNVVLSNGGKLTPARFLDLGINFGSPGGIDNIHMWVQRAANELEIFGELTTKMLQTIQAQQPYDGNPIYAIAHEAIYCQGFVHTP